MENDEAEMRLSELLGDRPDSVLDLALAARRKVRKAAGACSELVYATYAISSVHTYTGKLGGAFIHVAVYAKHVNLGFNRGAELEDPAKLLNGTGKLIRHVRLNVASDLQGKAIRDLIAAAVKQGRELAEKGPGVSEPSISFV
jgi:hypothetical protein